MRKFFQVGLFIWVFSFFLSYDLWGVQILSLEEVILIGIKNNPQINIASKIKEQYIYQKDIAKSVFFPFIYAEYSFQRLDQGKEASTIDYQKWGSYLNWNIFSGFSNWHNYKSALLLVSSQDENIKTTILNVALEITRAYLEYFKQKALYEASLSDLEDAKILLKLAQKRYEVGLSPYADVLEAQAKVKESEFKVTNYKYTAEIAKANVFTQINYDLTKIEEFEFLPVEEKKFEEKNLSEYIKMGLTKRPELKAKEKEILAQEEKVKSVKGEFYPSVDIFSSYYKYENLPEFDEEFIIGLKVNFPIFLGFSRIAKLKKEKTILEQKNFEKISTQLNIKQEIFNNYKYLQTAKENYETALAWLKSIEEDYKIIRKKYENGLASIVDVTTVLARLSQARSQVVVSKYDLIYAYYKLQKSLGVIPEIEK